MAKKHHPLLRKKTLTALLSGVVAIELLVILGALVLPGQVQFGAVLPSVVTALTNEARLKNNLTELKTSPVLTRAAQAKAEDMARRGYFSHNSPEGDLPWFWIDKEGYVYQYAGENLAINFTDSEELVKAWQNSPTHNMNLLGPRYTEIGIGMATGMYKGREAVYVVQFFAKPSLADLSVKASSNVLGAQTELPSPSAAEKIISSPRTYSTYIFLMLATLLIGVLVIGWGSHHPRALASGTLFVALLAGIIYMNKNFVFPEIELPSDNQNAAVILSQ